MRTQKTRSTQKADLDSRILSDLALNGNPLGLFADVLPKGRYVQEAGRSTQSVSPGTLWLHGIAGEFLQVSAPASKATTSFRHACEQRIQTQKITWDCS